MAEKDVKKFTRQMRVWQFKWVDMYAEWKVSNGVTQNVSQSVNGWLNDFELQWKDGMGNVNTSFSAEGFKATRKSAGVEATKDTFKTVHGGQVAAATSADGLTGRAQRNMLALLFKKELVNMFKEFDKVVENGFNLPLATKVKEFMKQPLFKNAVHLVDKAGKHWETGNYAAMYSRTKGADIYNQTVMSDMNDLGMDVVQVSPIATDTPICSQFVGRFYSLSGNHPTLPTLEITPPFHPNCVHDLLTVRPVDGMAEQNRKLDSKTQDLTTAQKKGIKKGEDYIRLNRPNVYAGAEAV